MIHLHPKKFPQLKGCKRFRSKTRNIEKERKRFKGLTQAAEEELERRAAEFKITVRKLKSIPCEVDIQAGCQEGRSVVIGNIYAPELNSFHNLEELIPRIIHESYALAQDFPTITFVLRYHQTLEFTDIEY